MAEIIKLEPFPAMISKQGKDHHLHLPRRLYKKLAEDGAFNKKFKVRVILEELPTSNRET